MMVITTRRRHASTNILFIFVLSFYWFSLISYYPPPQKLYQKVQWYGSFCNCHWLKGKRSSPHLSALGRGQAGICFIWTRLQLWTKATGAKYSRSRSLRGSLEKAFCLTSYACLIGRSRPLLLSQDLFPRRRHLPLPPSVTPKKQYRRQTRLACSPIPERAVGLRSAHQPAMKSFTSE